MTSHWISRIVGISAAFLLGSALAPSALGQQAISLSVPRSAVEASSLVSVTPPQAPSPHKFWDKQNQALFAAVAALNVADFSVTRSNLQNGGRELNPLTRPFSGSTAGLAVNFAGETAGVMGIAYLFHKTGHHKLERFTSILNIGGSAAAVSYDVAHR